MNLPIDIELRLAYHMVKLTRTLEGKLKFSLSQARTYRGINQESFAGALGVSVPTLIKYERNPEKMRVGQAKKCAELLGLSFDGTDFIGTSEEQQHSHE